MGYKYESIQPLLVIPYNLRKSFILASARRGKLFRAGGVSCKLLLTPGHSMDGCALYSLRSSGTLRYDRERNINNRGADRIVKYSFKSWHSGLGKHMHYRIFVDVIYCIINE